MTIWRGEGSVQALGFTDEATANDNFAHWCGVWANPRTASWPEKGISAFSWIGAVIG